MLDLGRRVCFLYNCVYDLYDRHFNDTSKLWFIISKIIKIGIVIVRLRGKGSIGFKANGHDIESFLFKF